MSFNSFRIDIPGPPHRYATPSPPLSAVEPISPAFPRGLLDETSFFDVSTKLGAQSRLRSETRYTAVWNGNNGDETESEDGSPDLPVEEDESRRSLKQARERKDSASTIDALATIALATSPTFGSQLPPTSMSPAPSLFPRDGFGPTVETEYGNSSQGVSGVHGAAERPPKRARSEAISPQKSFDTLRRPVMSPYTPSGSFHQHHHSVDSALDDRPQRELATTQSRYEAMNTDAELLLNLARGVSFSPLQERASSRSQNPWGNPPVNLSESVNSPNQPPLSQNRKSSTLNGDHPKDPSLFTADRNCVDGLQPAQSTEASTDDISIAEHNRLHLGASPAFERQIPKLPTRGSGKDEIGSVISFPQQQINEVTPSPARPKSDIDDSKPVVGQRYSTSTYSDMQLDEHHGLRLAASPPSDGTDGTFHVHKKSNAQPSSEADMVAGQGAVCAGCNFSRNTLNGEAPDATSWISCDGCKRWFHFACAGFKNEREVRSVDKFNCRECKPTCGPTTFVRKSSRAHTAIDYAELNEGIVKVTDESPEHHYIKPIKEGTIKFLPDNFARMRPELVTAEFFEKGNGMKEPVVIPAHLNPRPKVWVSGEDTEFSCNRPSEGADGDTLDTIYNELADMGQDSLDMVIPQNLTVRDVAQLYGPDEKVEVIDVKSQEGEGKSWNMRRWADYYESKGEKVIRNVISLEVSSSKLGRLIQRPKVVRDLDLQDAVWPVEGKAKGDFPKVQFYCLMSVEDCFTDFHIDFGGSSVFYHVLKGKKTFFFIPPKNKNLKKYEEWCMSPAQNWTFLPDQTKECYRVDLSEGDTMLIPSGWIHAVWTPENSLVIGGNFLTRLNYGMQIRIAEIEKATKVARKFRYPHFQKVLWYTAIRYLEDDPIPENVINDFYSGRKFYRETPAYYLFDKWGDNSIPGSENYHSRYYSQHELEGLPDLARYLLRTVLISMGKITEGITVDTRNAVTRSIPKGYGEPLQIVKNLAMWSAWKRGNELIPHWAYPDVIPAETVPKSQSKKLSAAAVKKLERQAAMESYRTAPERQSVRQQSQAEAAALKRADGSPTTRIDPIPTESRKRKASTGSTVIGGADVQLAKRAKKVVSTPKTSVLGPRRVACDACRRRRIRCKHKDELFPGAADNSHHGTASSFAPSTSYATSSHKIPSEFDSEQRTQGNEIHHLMHSSHASYMPSEAVQSTPVGSKDHANAHTPDARKIRNKACSNCRKSKRRCIHDEYGNVDPVKAQEASMSRTSGATAKRRAKTDEQDPRSAKKIKREHGNSNEQGIVWLDDTQGDRVIVPADESNDVGMPAAPSSSEVGNAIRHDQLDGLMPGVQDEIMSRSSTPSTIIADDITDGGSEAPRHQSVESADDVQLVPASPGSRPLLLNSSDGMKQQPAMEFKQRAEHNEGSQPESTDLDALQLISTAKDGHSEHGESASEKPFHENAGPEVTQEKEQSPIEPDLPNGQSKPSVSAKVDQILKIEPIYNGDMEVESPLTSPPSDGHLSTPSVRSSPPLAIAESDQQTAPSARTDRQEHSPPAFASRVPETPRVAARHSLRQSKSVQRFSPESVQGSYTARKSMSNHISPPTSSSRAPSSRSKVSKKIRSLSSPSKVTKRTHIQSSTSPSHSRHIQSVSPNSKTNSATTQPSASLSPTLKKTMHAVAGSAVVDEAEEESMRLARELAATQFSLRRRS